MTSRLIALLALVLFLASMALPAVGMSTETPGAGWQALFMGFFSFMVIGAGTWGIAAFLGWVSNWLLMAQICMQLSKPDARFNLAWTVLCAAGALAGSLVGGHTIPSPETGKAMVFTFASGAYFWMAAHAAVVVSVAYRRIHE